MKKLLLLGIALLAVYMGGRAARKNVEVLQLLWALVGMTAMASTANTPKARSTEARLNSLIPAVFPNTGGTISGSVNVTGNHSVGGSLNGPGGTGTLTVGTPMHVNGAGATVDGAFTSHSSISADGSVTAGGNMQVGGSLAGSGGGTLEVSAGVHAGGTLLADGNVTVGGTLAASGGTLSVGSAVSMAGGFTANGGSTVHGNFAVDNALHVSGVQIDPTQVTEGSAGSAPATYSSSYVQGLTNRVNQLIAVYG